MHTLFSECRCPMLCFDMGDGEEGGTTGSATLRLAQCVQCSIAQHAYIHALSLYIENIEIVMHCMITYEAVTSRSTFGPARSLSILSLVWSSICFMTASQEPKCDIRASQNCISFNTLPAHVSSKRPTSKKHKQTQARRRGSKRKSNRLHSVEANSFLPQPDACY